MITGASPRRRGEVIDALRRGTVPANGLDLLAVGLERFGSALDAELDAVSGGSAAFKAVRGEYGSGKTFFTRHLPERALRQGWATAEVQVSETETPLHRLETVYRRITARRGDDVMLPAGKVTGSRAFGLGRRWGEERAVDQLEAGLARHVGYGDLAPPLALGAGYPGDQEPGSASGCQLHPHVAGRIHWTLDRLRLHGRHAFAERPEVGVDSGRHMAQGNHRL